MPIICIEGPSAAGKSTLAAGLVARFEGDVVPEVNELFARPAEEPPQWYLQRQVDRWRAAVALASAGRLAVLDGDVFQPLWYGWAYGFKGVQPLDEIAAFYREQIAASRIAFPARYVVLSCPEDELLRRRDTDSTRRRRKFEEHLAFIEPQRRYFCALDAADPGRVTWLPSGSRDEALRLAGALIAESHAIRPPDADLLEAMLSFCDSRWDA